MIRLTQDNAINVEHKVRLGDVYMARREGLSVRGGEMTVREAGRKGGETTKRTHGHEFYVQIGHKGGQKVRDLINRAKMSESR